MHDKFEVEFYKGGVLAINEHCLSSGQDLIIGYSTGVRALHLNIEFECKCVVDLLGCFAVTITGHYICSGSPIVVDSSVLTLLTLLH